MNYSQQDLETIRTKYAPAGTVCRVVTVRHLAGDRYRTVHTHFFATRVEGMDFASNGASEVRMPGYQYDIAFSADGKWVRMLTYFGKEKET
jgi:hypothetical protein